MPKRSGSASQRGLWRVVAEGPDGAWQLRQGAQTCNVVGLDAAQPGDWWRAPTAQRGWTRVVAAPPAWLQPDGDPARMHHNDALHARMLRARHHVLRAIRQFFWQRSFVEVDPPMLATCPGLELHLDAVQAQVRTGMGGERTTRWLVTSPEYHCKRLLTAGEPKIFSLQHAFRSGERGQHHNPEFAMLEWYRTDSTYLAIVRDLQQLVRACAAALAADPLTAGLLSLPPAVLQRQPWPRIAIRTALRQFAGFDPGRYAPARLHKLARQAGLDVRAADSPGDVVVQALVERVEPALAAIPVVVLDRWPVALASLAAPFARQPWLAQRFEVYLQGVELANGFTELTDPDEQARRFAIDLAERQRTGRPVYPQDERFLAALREGCPPAAGVALGVDRLLMALTGQHDIDQALFFPFERA